MTTIIARRKIVDTLRDGRFRWGGVVVLGLLALALAAGWSHQREIAATHDAAERQTWQHWLEQGEKNPHSAAHYGVYAFKPITPLSLIDQGVDAYVGVATWLEAHWQNPFEYRPAQDAAALARFGRLTAAGIMQLLIPLLIILFAFSVISAEREEGTLRQVLSVGVRPRTLLVGSGLGVAGALGLLLVPAAVLGAAALVAATGSHGIGLEPGRVLLLALAYLAYFAVFVGLTVAVSTRAPSSRFALVALLAFWILNALVAPRAAADLAESLHPLPSTAEFDGRIRAAIANGIDGHDPAQQRQQALRDSVLAAHGAARLEDLPVNYAGIALQAGEDYGNRVFDVHFGDLASTMERQERIHRFAGIGAPLLAVRTLSMGLAGTDVARHQHFVRAAEQHRRLIQRILNDDIRDNSRFGETYLAGPELWASIPPFEYRPPDLAWSLGRQRESLFVLLFWLGLAVALVPGAARTLRVD